MFNLCIFWDLDLTLCNQIPHELSPWPNIEKNCLHHQWMFWLKKWVTWKLPHAKLPTGWFPPANFHQRKFPPRIVPPGQFPPRKTSTRKIFTRITPTQENSHLENCRPENFHTGDYYVEKFSFSQLPPWIIATLLIW